MVAILIKASVIQRFLQGDDVSGDGTTDVNTLSLNGSAVSHLDPTLSDGGLPDTFAGVTVDTTAPTTMPIIQIQQTQPITIDNFGTAEIRGASSQAVIFEGATGTLKLDDAPAFTGQISGLTGADAVDLADISYGANTKATFSGNANGGTLTVTNGTQTANIALLGNYLSSGWTLSSDGHGGTVVVDPPLTFPNALNTGVPAGTALKIYTGPSTITTNGADLSGYIFTSTLTIAANNVTIENSKFDVSGTCIQIENADLQTNQYTGTLIKNCEMAGETNGVVVGNNEAIQGANLTVLNCNIHGYAKDINCEGSNITVEGSYLWNESAGGTGAHLENIICDGVGSNFNFSNNTIVNTQDNTTTIFNATDFGSSSNVTINGNLLYGGASYTLYVGALNNVSVTNNVMAAINNYGYLTYSTPTNFTWANNTDLFTGQVISLGNKLSPNPNIVIASFTPTNSFTGEFPTFGAEYCHRQRYNAGRVDVGERPGQCVRRLDTARDDDDELRRGLDLHNPDLGARHSGIHGDRSGGWHHQRGIRRDDQHGQCSSTAARTASFAARSARARDRSRQQQRHGDARRHSGSELDGQRVRWLNRARHRNS